MIGYYDYVLGVIPGSLVGLTALLVVAGVEPLVAMPIGAAVAALVVGHALFVNGPVGSGDDGTAARSAPPMNAD